MNVKEVTKEIDVNAFIAKLAQSYGKGYKLGFERGYKQACEDITQATHDTAIKHLQERRTK